MRNWIALSLILCLDQKLLYLPEDERLSVNNRQCFTFFLFLILEAIRSYPILIKITKCNYNQAINNSYRATVRVYHTTHTVSKEIILIINPRCKEKLQDIDNINKEILN